MAAMKLWNNWSVAGLAIAVWLSGCGVCAPVESGSTTADMPFSQNGLEREQLRAWEVRQLFSEGRSLQRQGQLERAAALYEKAWDLDRARLEILPYWGLTQAELGNSQRALELYELYLQEEPDEPLVLFNQAAVLAELGRYAEAEHILEQIAQAQQGVEGETETGYDLLNSGSFWALFGLTSYKLGNNQKAVECCQKALSCQPDSVSASLVLAAAYRQQGEIKQACEVLVEACQKNPSNPEPINNLAVIQAENGLGGAAETNWRLAGKGGLESAELNLFSWQVLHNKEVDILALAELTDRFPGNPWAEFLYGVGLYRQKRYGEAQQIFAEVADTAEGELKASSNNYLALVYWQQGDKRALELWQELYNNRGGDVVLAHNLAVAYGSAGLYEQALELAWEARRLVHERLVDCSNQAEREKLRAGFEPVYYNLFYLCEKNGQIVKAKQALAEWRHFFPKSAEHKLQLNR